MDIDALRLFTSIATTHSFSKSALQEGITQATASKRILALELDLGCRLFERNGRGATLTEAGKRLLARAETLLSEIDGMRAVLKDPTSEPQGLVRLGLQPSISWPLVGHLCRRINATYPQLRLQIRENSTRELRRLIEEKQLDVALLTNWGQESLVQAEPLFRTRLFLMSRPDDPLTAAPTLSFEKLQGVPLLLTPMPNGSRLLLEETARQQGVSLHILYDVYSLHLIKKMVRDGLGYGIAYQDAVNDEISRGELRATLLTNPDLTEQFFLWTTAELASRQAAQAVAQLLRNITRHLAYF